MTGASANTMDQVGDRALFPRRGLLSLAWYILIGRRLIQLARGAAKQAQAIEYQVGGA